MKKKGFSLLELLVSIGIISVLLAAGVSSYSTAQKKARDARRKGDLKNLQQSLEQYYSICGYQYPANPLTPPVACTTPPTVNLLPTVPVDPKTGAAYTCSGCSTSGYTICPVITEIDSISCISNQQ